MGLLPPLRPSLPPILVRRISERKIDAINLTEFLELYGPEPVISFRNQSESVGT